LGGDELFTVSPFPPPIAVKQKPVEFVPVLPALLGGLAADAPPPTTTG
jgi:hypothetical protein